MAKYKSIAFAVVSLTALSAQAENLSGIHIGDTRSSAIAKLGRPIDSNRAGPVRSGPVNYDKWILEDHNELSITSRAGDDTIVYIESDGVGRSDLTDFPGLLFGRTTRRQLIDKFGTGVAFRKRVIPWTTKEGDDIFTLAYELGPQIVAFITKAPRQSLEALAQKGKSYFIKHYDDNLTLAAIVLGDREYLRSLWGEMAPTSGPGSHYRRLEPFTFQPTETAPTENDNRHDEIALEAAEGGGWRLPVLINQNLSVPFVLDTGAFSVQIPADVYSVMQRQGTIKPEDARGTTSVVLADGSTHNEPRFLLHNLKVGDKILTDILATVSPTGTDPLLGQSFLDRLGRYTVDNQRHVLILE